MPTTDEDDAVEQIKRKALPSSIGLHYGKQIWGHPWVLYPWIEMIEQVIIEAILDTTNESYIIVNAPPQTGKSSWCGILLPFWYTGYFPDNQLMYISYSDDFSRLKGTDVRRMHERYGADLFGTAIDPDIASSGEWRIAGHFGGMLSVGVGGLITGRPGHLIIIDDLIKNSVEAASVATKKMHLSEWDNTISTRLQPGGTVIIIATRWAEDDLSGAVQARMKEPDYNGPRWQVLDFPAFAMPHDDIELTDEELEAWRDILGRELDEVLDCRFSRIPGRDPRDYFEKKRSSMDAFSWTCLFQQRPSVRKGGMFPVNRWKRYDPSQISRADMDQMVRVWDLAATENAGDWTVGTLVGKKDRSYYILDVNRFRKDAGGVLDEVTATAKADGFGIKILIEEEKGGAGKSVVESYRRLLVGHTVEAAKAEGSKESRATPYSAEQNKGNVWIPKDGSVDWDVKAFTDEHRKMMGDGRKPAHDDQIDTAAYGMLEFIGIEGADVFIPSADLGADALRALDRGVGGLDEVLAALAIR